MPVRIWNEEENKNDTVPVQRRAKEICVFKFSENLNYNFNCGKWEQTFKDVIDTCYQKCPKKWSKHNI